MPPTVLTGSRKSEPSPSASSSRKLASTDKKADLLCRIKYFNTLPDIPFEPKVITYPFEQTRFIQYNATSLERAYKHELLTEHDLGVTIDLINPDTYRITPNAPGIHPKDEDILEEERQKKDNLSERSAMYVAFHIYSVFSGAYEKGGPAGPVETTGVGL